ncbi:MAG: hypothetical protein JSV91_09635 [Phycisphaerales bacterium]|nr:MAG: hypothetical protein JSV91_09635 [Phycisphaerales bacterium]
MNHLLAILGLAVACILWGLLQRWIARVDPDVGADPHCGCHHEELREIASERGDR